MENKSVLRRSRLFCTLQTIGGTYKQSAVGRFFGAFKRAWRLSRTQKVTDRLLGMRDTVTLNSLYSKIYGAAARWLSRVGAAIRPAAEGSLLNRLWHAKWLRSGVVFSTLFGQSMRRFIIMLFALYLPVDWILRDILPLAAVANLWDEAFLVFGLFYAVFQRLCAPESEHPRVTPLDLFIFAFCILGGVLMVTTAASGLRIAISGYRAVVQYMLWFFVLTRVIRDEEDVRTFVVLFVAIGVCTALHGIYQYIIGAKIPSHWVSQAEQGVRSRAFSIFGSPNIMGCFMVMSAPLAASLAYGEKTIERRALAWIAVLVIGAGCLFTFSRGAWLGFAAMIAVFAWLRDKRLYAVIALAVGVALTIPEVVGRITFLFTKEFEHASQFGGRQGRWREGLRLLNSADPILGFGLGRFGGAVAMQNQVIPGLPYFYMDNYYLKTLVEMGYVGLGGYIVLLVATLWVGLRAAYRSKGTAFEAIACGLLAGMVGTLTHCFTENIFEVPYMNAYFWGMAAILVWLGFLRRPSANR